MTSFVHKLNKGGFILKFIEEFTYDMDFTEPRIIIKDNICIIENVKSIIMISEKAVTVESSKKYVTVFGNDFIIQGVELLHTSNKNKGGRFWDR